MKLIECTKQEQLINALLIKKRNNYNIVSEDDVNALIFLIEEDLEYIGVLSILCNEENVEIKDVVFNDSGDDSTLTRMLECLENYCKTLQFKNIIYTCEIEDSYVFKNNSYSSHSDIFIENDKLCIKMLKTLA